MKRDESQTLLEKYEIKATAPRKAILALLTKEHKPLTLAHIARKSRDESMASVYRTLELFVRKGLIQIVALGERAMAYELVAGRTHHHHVICVKCGDLEDIAHCSVPAVKSVLSHSKKFVSLSHHSLEFFGTCKTCVKK